MIKELHGGIGKKKGQATIMTQVACPFSSVYSIKTNKCPFEEMGSSLGQEKKNDYGNTRTFPCRDLINQTTSIYKVGLMNQAPTQDESNPYKFILLFTSHFL